MLGLDRIQILFVEDIAIILRWNIEILFIAQLMIPDPYFDHTKVLFGTCGDTVHEMCHVSIFGQQESLS
jgi:hypothetical protein